MAADLLALRAGHSVAGAAADDPHLIIRRSQQRQTPAHLVAILGLPDLHMAQAVEPLRVHLGEASGHVLDDQHSRDVGGQALEDLQGGFGAAGGGAQADDNLIQVSPLAQRGHGSGLGNGSRGRLTHLRSCCGNHLLG